MISIVVPAHNEEAVIERFLSSVTSGAAPRELDITVVCNGCTDRTAEIVRHFSPAVRVLETDIPGKANALNMGDRVAVGFPRIYADADVLLSIEVVRALAARLASGDVLAVAPRALNDTTQSSWAVKSYYAIKDLLPSSRDGIGSSGVYALSAAGRARFGAFPNMVGDDIFVRTLFSVQERTTLLLTRTRVFAPRTLKALTGIMARAYYGNWELKARHPNRIANIGESNLRAALGLSRNMKLWPQISVFYYVALVSRYRAISKLKRKSFTWDRDSTSRA